MTVVTDFFLFLKRPDPNIKIEIIKICSYFGLALSGFLVLILIDLFSGLVLIPLKLLGLIPKLKDFDFTTYNIFRVSIFLPIIEELVFRLPLCITRLNIVVFFSSIIIFIFYETSIIFAFFLCLAIIILGLILIKENSKWLLYLSNLFTSNFIFFLYFQALIFGGLHLVNYKLETQNYIVLPFIILSQFITGLFLGYLRIRYSYGIFLCIFCHLMANSIYCIILSN